MYSRYLLKTSHFGCISDILFPFSRRTHRVRTAKMSLYIKNPSRNSSFRRFREYISYLIIIYTKMKFKARNIKFYVCIILLKILCYRLASVFVRFWDVMEYPALFIGLHPWQNNLKIVKYKNGNIWTISIGALVSCAVYNVFRNEDRAWKGK